MNKTIEITFAASGELEIEAVGFKGADCEKATALFERVLGRKTQERRKPEYYSSGRTVNVQKLGA